jgi:hypothetical protein
MSHYARSCYTRISKFDVARRTFNGPTLWCRFYTFPHYIETTTFGISCDAFANLKETLTRHKSMVAEYLDKNYDRVLPIRYRFSFPTSLTRISQFFSSFTTLILSNNYVTKRQTLKLLGEILLDRANFNVMTRYIANEGNLKMMMNLLRDKSKNIQFEAFHVFKVGQCSVARLRLCSAADYLPCPRCLSRIRRNRHRSRQSYAEIKRNFWCS